MPAPLCSVLSHLAMTAVDELALAAPMELTDHPLADLRMSGRQVDLACPISVYQEFEPRFHPTYNKLFGKITRSLVSIRHTFLMISLTNGVPWGKGSIPSNSAIVAPRSAKLLRVPRFTPAFTGAPQTRSGTYSRE